MLKETPYTKNDMQLVKRLCKAEISSELFKNRFNNPLQVKAIKEIAILYCKSVGVVPKCNPAYMRVSQSAKILGLLMMYHSNDTKFNLWITNSLLAENAPDFLWLSFYDANDYTAYSILWDMMAQYGISES